MARGPRHLLELNPDEKKRGGCVKEHGQFYGGEERSCILRQVAGLKSQGLRIDRLHWGHGGATV